MSLKKIFKPVALFLLYYLCFFTLLRKIQKNHVIVLMYHRFSGKKEPFKVQQTIFENQIKFLKKRYNFISLSHYSEFLNGQREDMPDNPIIITIDDGYKDNYDHAYPILKKHAIPATIFIAADFINNRSWFWFDKLKYIIKNTKYTEFDFKLGLHRKKFYLDSFEEERKTKLAIFDYCKTVRADEVDNLLNQLSEKISVHVPEKASSEFEPLTWEQIKEMHKNNIEFGSHTCSHPILSMLKHDELKKEIVSSKKEIALKLGSELDSFCYPVGKPEDINQDVLEITEEAGYSCAVTTIPGKNIRKEVNRFLLRRIAIGTDSKIGLSKILTFT